MKKTLFPFIILFFSLLFDSCRKCNRDQQLDPIVQSCFFKVGSYFIYNDSVDHIIDSEYVYQYVYARGQGLGGYTQENCNYSSDWVYMSQSSFRNGLTYDSVHTLSNFLNAINMYNSKHYLYHTNSRNEPSGSEMTVYNTTYATTKYYNFLVGGKVYPTVYESQIAISIMDNSDTIPISFYFAPNYGIIKRIEHRPTGDVSWDLIRYHIVN